MDWCKAVAAALFDGEIENKVVYEAYSATEIFEALLNDDVDMLSVVPKNLENDVKEPVTNVGYSFTKPVFYDGLYFAGRPQ